MAKTLPVHLQVPWRVRDGLTVFVAAWIGLPIVLVILLKIIAPAFEPAQQFLSALVNGDIVANFVFVLLDAIAGMGLVWMYLRKYKVGWKEVGWRKFSLWKAALLLVVLFGVFIIAVAVVLALATALIPGFNSSQPQVNDFTGTAARQHISLAVLALVVIPPIIEETVFRGFIFPALSKRVGLIWGAIGTSLLFGIAHLQANVSIYTFVLSLALCFMYWKLKSIVPGIVLHMANNLLAYLALIHS